MERLLFLCPVDGQMLTNAAGVRVDAAGIRVNAAGVRVDSAGVRVDAAGIRVDAADVHAQDELAVEVRVAAPRGRRIVVRDVPAVYRDGAYCAVVRLDGYRNTLEARDMDSGEAVTARVYWLRNANQTYALSLDDNIWFLQDLTRSPKPSLFDHPYPRIFKDLYDKYGTKTRMHLFYETTRQGGFDLSQMTDRYREEFQANAHWLHLAFHSVQASLSRPYEHSSYKQMRDEYLRVAGEIRRFAGQQVLEPAVTIHSCSTSMEATRALRALGVRALIGDLKLNEQGVPVISYYLSPEQVHWANEFGFWKDHTEDMIFGRLDLVMNYDSLESIPLKLDAIRERSPRRSSYEIMIHEQYFYPDYQNYMPDFRERVFAGVEWCVRQGLRPVFTGDAVAEW